MNVAGSKIANAVSAVATRMAARRAIRIADAVLQDPGFREARATELDQDLLIRAALARARVALEPARTAPARTAVVATPSVAPWVEKSDVPTLPGVITTQNALSEASSINGLDSTIGVSDAALNWETLSNTGHVNTPIGAVEDDGVWADIDGAWIDTDTALVLA